MKKLNAFFFFFCIAFAISLAYQERSAQKPADGSYTAEVTLEGGSGRASVQSPALLTVENGSYTAEIIWSSDKYDYMLVEGDKYLPVKIEGGSTFEIPVAGLDVPLEVVADTTAMSEPHEITYTLTFHSDTLEPEK